MSTKFKSEDFKEACELWATGDWTLAMLSERYGITTVWLSKKFKEAGVQKSQNQRLAREINNAAVEKAISDASVELKEYAIDGKAVPLRGAIMLMKKALFELKDAQDNKLPISSKSENLKALKDAIAILKEGYGIAEKVLKLDKEEPDDHDLPSLEIVEMTPAMVEDERSRQKAEDAAINGVGLDMDLSELIGDEEEDADSDVIEEAADGDDRDA